MPPPFADAGLLASARRDPAPVALAVVLAAALAFQVLAPSPPVGGVTAASPVRNRPAASPVATSGPAPASVNVVAIVDRSIFSPSRTSGAAPAAAADVNLLGVARSGGVALATLGDRAGATASLRPGESWQGWTLAAVGQGVAVLRRNDAILTLHVGQPLAAPPSTGAP